MRPLWLAGMWQHCNTGFGIPRARERGEERKKKRRRGWKDRERESRGEEDREERILKPKTVEDKSFKTLKLRIIQQRQRENTLNKYLQRMLHHHTP